MLVYGAEGTRLYPDASASLSVVFSPTERTFGSSTEVIRLTSPIEHDELAEHIGIPGRDGWYPFGLTRLVGVKRLLPNHYLDLESYEMVRFRSPASARSEVEPEVLVGFEDQIVREIFGLLQSNIRAVAHSFDPALTLTAGRDSRIVLLAALDLGLKIDCFTTELPDGAGFLDVMVAERLARLSECRYTSFPWKTPRSADVAAWLRRTGHAIGGRSCRSATTMEGKLADRVVVSGLCGEMGRTFYWREKDLSFDARSPQVLLERMNIPSHPLLLDGAAAWLDDLREAAWPDVLDFAYQEQRLGCWSAAAYYGPTHGITTFSPFNSEVIFDLFLALPYAFRLRDGLYPTFPK